MRVAVVGGRISGLASAYLLAKGGVNVVLYEKEDLLGGHAKTVNVDGVDVDLGLMVFNRAMLLDLYQKTSLLVVCKMLLCFLITILFILLQNHLILVSCFGALGLLS